MRTSGSKFDVTKTQLIEAMLFLAVIHEETLSITCQAVQVKVGEITKSLRTKK